MALAPPVFGAKTLNFFANENWEQVLIFCFSMWGYKSSISARKKSSYFMESKITSDLEAKTEQKINYPPDFDGLPRGIGKFFDPGPILYV